MDEQKNAIPALPVDEYHGIGGTYILLPDGKRVPAGSEAAQAKTVNNAQPAQIKTEE